VELGADREGGHGQACEHQAGRELPPGETAREYNSYCGNYDYDGTNLVTRVDASASNDRIDSEQKRFVQFVGEHMVLTQKPRLWQGVMQHRELIWERVADAPAS